MNYLKIKQLWKIIKRIGLLSVCESHLLNFNYLFSMCQAQKTTYLFLLIDLIQFQFSVGIFKSIDLVKGETIIYTLIKY